MMCFGLFVGEGLSFWNERGYNSQAEIKCFRWMKNFQKRCIIMKLSELLRRKNERIRE